jgi:Ca-activated chloride channel family protein
MHAGPYYDIKKEGPMWLRLFLATFVFCLFHDSTLAEDQSRDPGRAILVLDASGSMWGKVKGRTKVEIARESIARLMKAWDPEIELGLIAYGHRRKGDCGDIELVLPVARHRPEDVVKAVSRLNARGKTPLSAAVKKAAETLGYSKERATVILISDGIETCGMDPCAVAEELERVGVAFTAHVIGFDLKKEELADLQCLAEGTGGMFIEAVDAASLTEALTTVEESVAAAPPAPRVPPASRLAAVLKSGMEPLDNQEINWDVTAPDRGPDGTYKAIGKYRHVNPRLRLGTGKYRVQVKTGLVVAETMIHIDAENPAEHVVDLNAGRLALIGYNKQGGERLSGNTRWILNAGEDDGKGKIRQLTYTNFSSPTFTLPEGSYEAVLQSGLARASVRVDIRAGDVVEKKVFLNAGQVSLRAVLNEGGPPIQESIHWYLTVNTPDKKGEYKTLSHNSNRSPTFTVGAGRHRFVVTAGSASKVFEVDIQPDRLMEKSVSLDAGKVKMVALDKASGQPLKKVRWTVTRPEKNARGAYDQVTYSSYHTPGFTLRAGRYRVIIGHGSTQSISMINVKAGDNREIRVQVQASP